MRRKLSLRQPVILFALAILLVVALTVLWNVVLVQDYAMLEDLAGEGDFHWFYIALGSTLCVGIIVLASILGVQLFTNIRWSRRQSDFVASVSHELNSPLGSIKLFAQTLRNEDLAPEDRARFVGKILVDADRLSRIIANILRAAEMDNRGDVLAVDPTEVDFAAYLRAYVEDVRAERAGKIEIELGRVEEAWVEIDPVMFRQVLDNLVDNTIRYCGNAPARLEFGLEVRDGAAELYAADQGIGIPRERLPHVFDRFYKVGEGGQGMGIGLSVVHAIVRSHGGEVGAQSDGLGRGTRVWIRLPALERATEAVG